MTALCVVAVIVGAFEVLSGIWLNAPEVVGQIVAGSAGVIFLISAGAMWARRSVTAATVAGVLLLVDVGGIPFFERSSIHDWVIQGCFAVVGIIGIVAWLSVLRERRAEAMAVRT
jgi:hypothetical protein